MESGNCLFGSNILLMYGVVLRKGECCTDDYRNGYRYRKGRLVCNPEDSSTAIDCFAGDWSMCQYFSDSYFDSGADTYFCAKDCRDVSMSHGIR